MKHQPVKQGQTTTPGISSSPISCLYRSTGIHHYEINLSNNLMFLVPIKDENRFGGQIG